MVFEPDPVTRDLDARGYSAVKRWWLARGGRDAAFLQVFGPAPVETTPPAKVAARVLPNPLPYPGSRTFAPTARW